MEQLIEKPYNTSYILEVYFNAGTISKIKYKDLPNVHFFFCSVPNFKRRSLIIDNWVCCWKRFEFDQEEYQVIPSLNGVTSAAASFIQNKIVIVGGVACDRIGILDWDEFNRGSPWIVSQTKFPIKISNHSMVTYNNKLYVIGGVVWSEDDVSSGTIWEGTFDSLNNKISWVKLRLRLQRRRYGHFCFVISNQIIVFGGEYIDDDVVEIIQRNESRQGKMKLNYYQGPKVPSKLHAYYDQAILDRNGRIIITSNEHGLIIYDHHNRSFKKYPNLKLREERKGYAAILQ